MRVFGLFLRAINLGWTTLWVSCSALGVLAAIGLWLVARAVDRESAQTAV